jgi:ABC-2 type transport system permease protein
MFERLKAFLVKEFIQVLRDPRMKMSILIAPVLQLFIFGYAATTDVTNIPTGIYDLDNTPQSREVIRAFIQSKYFEAKEFILDDKQMTDAIDKSKVNLIIRFNRGFAQDIIANRPAKIQLIVDGTDSNTGSVILAYANSILQKYSSRLLTENISMLPDAGKIFPSVELKSRAWFNENLLSRNYYIPGVISLIVTIMSLMLTAMAVVREKEIGTIEQLIVSPLKPVELIIGKLLPFAVIALFDVVFVTTIGVLWFKIPMRGSLLLLFAATLIYLTVSLSVGLLISTISATQQEAMMSTFLFFFPANLLSGFIFPIANMPKFVQLITYLNPLRYFIEILRGIFLKGIGINILWPDMLILFIMGVTCLLISSLRFHKTLG